MSFMNEEIIKERKRIYFLLMILGMAFILFLLTFIFFSQKEKKEKIKLPATLKEEKKAMPVFSCGEKLFYNGDEYKTIKIDQECWLAENLRTSKYGDGSPIPYLQSEIDWRQAKEGAYGCYENSKENCQKYGALYNWLVIAEPKGICPQGWRVPSHQDWARLEMKVCQRLGYGNCQVPFGEDSPFGWKGKDEGKHLKSKDFQGLDSFGLNILLAGFRTPDGSFAYLGKKGAFWSSGNFGENFAYARMFDLEKDTIRRFSENKKSGFSLRCLKE